MRLSESAGGLSVGYSAWLGLLLLSLGIALAVYVARHFKTTGRTFSYVAVTFICLYAGWHFLAFKAELTAEGARVYEPLRRDDRILWSEVTGLRIEERLGGRGGRSTHLVFDGGVQPFDIVVSSLSAEDRVRVMRFAEERMKPTR
jgi:hypothetical protein